jgi:hypothetical protein
MGSTQGQAKPLQQVKRPQQGRPRIGLLFVKEVGHWAFAPCIGVKLDTPLCRAHTIIT